MKRYGKWVGSPRGILEDITHCIIEVWGDWHSHQCQHKRGYGEDGLFCKQHAKLSSNSQRLRTPKDEA